MFSSLFRSAALILGLALSAQAGLIMFQPFHKLDGKSLGKPKPFFNPNLSKFPLQMQVQFRLHPFPEKSL